jgi:hypothetical protein
MSNTLPTDKTFRNLFFRHVLCDSDTKQSGTFNKALFGLTHFKLESDVSTPDIVAFCSEVHLLYSENLIPILRHDGHTLDATLLSLGRLARNTSSTGTVERENGEDKQQNKNDGGTLHLLRRPVPR